jgi:hypothetical protein
MKLSLLIEIVKVSSAEVAAGARLSVLGHSVELLFQTVNA